jgi:RHS repeat-associated protein
MTALDSNIGNGNDDPEKLIFFYHSDHLGSTSYITNLDGAVTQHVEYIPFGEVFLEERNNVWNTPYLFNSKELDEETGLYYYGARYYNPRESVWLSVDKPLIDGTYMSGIHNGGVYNSFNLNGYMYCYQNPVRLIDPDGNQVDFKKALEIFNQHATGIRAVYNNRNAIIKYAKKYNVPAQAIGSIIYQEKAAGIRGDLSNAYAENFKADKTTSLGLGEIQVQKAMELNNKEGMGLNVNNQQHIDWTIDALKDPDINIEYIAMNIKDMQEYIGRGLTIKEATYGHNAGKENLKKLLDAHKNPENRVSKRSKNWQEAIKDALNGKLNVESDTNRKNAEKYPYGYD